MDIVNILIVAAGSAILGIIGGFAARSVYAGIILGVFVFVGWFLWRVFKVQEAKENEGKAEDKEEI